ncbi:hypothetical protein C7H19_03085 [Aphanothece hegewaldii CCALA 016]|uniref:Methyltransferase FkbM domain-containing protein n=1 Tax=Aphanothece hegewaldii CCALA 016 TaxID=2107694 RepID=A0A2T1M2S2_9CHRO|nr:hypothetical protein [Aphanothece hegewaldii]PSF39051.1 hypothetical protein C7H19_03085 [Aphanothece hegewaldii CCALA 016]
MLNPFRKFSERLQNIQNELKQLNTTNKALLKTQESLKNIMIEDYLKNHLINNPKYSEPKKLNKYEFKAYSQGGEDGIINEIFRRIGTTNQYFVEFGVGVGLENNSALLLTLGWRGLWIEGSEKYCKNIKEKFKYIIKNNQLTLINNFVDADNIESLFKKANVPEELDLLSIDIDGNDYWIWKAINQYRPRVVIIEYNAAYPPQVSWTIEYNPNHRWDYSNYMGASLLALEKLGIYKGYKLVGCSFTGVNAFFVRDDLVNEHFLEPYTAENHYEPARYFLCEQTAGHPRSFGKFETV